MKNQPIPLTPEAQAFVERMIQERDAATQRLDVALYAMKAALGAPASWTIRNLDEGFIPPAEPESKDE